MSQEEGAQLASRALGLLMIVWVLVDVTQLPQTVLGLAHHLQQSSVPIPQTYWTIYYLAGLSSHLVRIVGLSSAALWFWKFGPGVKAAFGIKRDTPPAA